MNSFEVCPNCHGQKTVSRPSWVAGDVDTWSGSGTEVYPCPTCESKGVIKIENNQIPASGGEKIPPDMVVGNYQFYPYQVRQFDEPKIFAYSLALVDFNEDDGCGEFYTYLDFWVVKDIDELKKTLKRRGVTVDSKNYQIKVFYTDGSWDFVSLKDVLT